MCETKKCSKCGQVKPITDFSQHKLGKGGRKSSCKECCVKDNRKYRTDNREKVSAASSEYYVKNKQRILERQTAWSKANPEKNVSNWAKYYAKNKKAIYERNVLHYKTFPEQKKAHNLVSVAIRNGLLEPPETCQICESTSYVEYHHPDYSKPLEVVPLCKRCHQQLHAELRRKETQPVTGLNVGVDFPANLVGLVTVGPSLL